MFQLTAAEFHSLRSQIVILEPGRGRYPKHPPYAFTEQGVAALALCPQNVGSVSSLITPKLRKAPKMRTYSRFSDKRPSAGTAVIPRARAGYRDIRGVVNLLLRGPEGKSHGEAA